MDFACSGLQQRAKGYLTAAQADSRIRAPRAVHVWRVDVRNLSILPCVDKRNGVRQI